MWDIVLSPASQAGNYFLSNTPGSLRSPGANILLRAKRAFCQPLRGAGCGFAGGFCTGGFCKGGPCRSILCGCRIGGACFVPVSDSCECI